MQHFVYCVSVACFLPNSHGLAAEPPDTNYAESKAPAYELPELLVDGTDRPIGNREQWLGPILSGTWVNWKWVLVMTST